jgi:transcriptional regulator with XRE-family HTH domain
MQEQRTNKYESGVKPFVAGGKTFGGYIAMRREMRAVSVTEAAKRIGISGEYLTELETDVRYPPTGALYKKIVEFYSSGDPEIQSAFSEICGPSRKEIPEDTVEFLRRNWYARYILDLMRQIDLDPTFDTTSEEQSTVIRDAILAVAENKGIKIVEPIDDEE